MLSSSIGLTDAWQLFKRSILGQRDCLPPKANQREGNRGLVHLVLEGKAMCKVTEREEGFWFLS